MPKPHTPFQWAAQCAPEVVDARLRALGGALRADRSCGKSIGYRYHDGQPGIIEGLLSRGDRRVGRVILAAWRDGARFDGWSEHFSFERWTRSAESALATEPVDVAWYTTRERDYSEVLPWDHLDAGLDRDWLWQDWQDSIAPEGAAEVEDCRWTPCYECGVCSAMGTEIQVGPTGERLDGRRLLPAQRPAVQHLVVRYAKRGKMRFASHRDLARVFERGVRRAGLPIAYSAGFTPHPRISYAGGAPTGVASEAEYLSLALTSRQAAAQVRERLNATLPDGIDVIDVMDDADGPTGDHVVLGALEASRWRVVLPGVEAAAAERAVAGFLALSEALVERLTDKGVRRLDARAAVVTLDVLEATDPDCGPRAATGVQDCAILRMVVRHTVPAVRPDDVLTALREQYGLVPSWPPITTRLAQGSLALLAGTGV